MARHSLSAWASCASSSPISTDSPSPQRLKPHSWMSLCEAAGARASASDTLAFVKRTLRNFCSAGLEATFERSLEMSWRAGTADSCTDVISDAAAKHAARRAPVSLGTSARVTVQTGAVTVQTAAISAAPTAAEIAAGAGGVLVGGAGARSSPSIVSASIAALTSPWLRSSALWLDRRSNPISQQSAMRDWSTGGGAVEGGAPPPAPPTPPALLPIGLATRAAGRFGAARAAAAAAAAAARCAAAGSWTRGGGGGGWGRLDGACDELLLSPSVCPAPFLPHFFSALFSLPPEKNVFRLEPSFSMLAPILCMACSTSFFFFFLSSSSSRLSPRR